MTIEFIHSSSHSSNIILLSINSLIQFSSCIYPFSFITLLILVWSIASFIRCVRGSRPLVFLSPRTGTVVLTCDLFPRLKHTQKKTPWACRRENEKKKKKKSSRVCSVTVKFIHSIDRLSLIPLSLKLKTRPTLPPSCATGPIQANRVEGCV